MSKFQVGDRVEVTIVGNVTRTVSSAGSSTEYLSLNDDVHVFTGTPGIQVRKLAPPKPTVGDVITGARLKATPWKRGTVIADVDGVLMLRSDGQWHSMGAEFSYPFSDFFDAERLTVVYLP